MDPFEAVALVFSGIAIGTYATAVGAGGGFLLAPLLLLRYEDATPSAIATASLAVVVLNSGVSAVTAARARQVDLRLAAVLVAAVLPAGIGGALVTSMLPRAVFALLFAALLAGAGAYLAWRPAQMIVTPISRGWQREFIDGAGDTFRYRVPIARGMVATAGSAAFAALAGIGGGLIYTPLTTRFMHVPYALAVPISQTVNAAMAVAVVTFHIIAGHAGDPMRDAPALALGVVVSVPLGRRLNRRLGEGNLMRLLAVGLLLVSIRTALIAL
ncbi:MAG: sulfite exporter TauE/SafE family protein [Dehalococcoidia bacterium]|jgi:hypothetical protein|nr:sulfite exporter TauE/SafE family protein [Dehalococcoidia bacterium]